MHTRPFRDTAAAIELSNVVYSALLPQYETGLPCVADWRRDVGVDNVERITLLPDYRLVAIVRSKGGATLVPLERVIHMTEAEAIR